MSDSTSRQTIEATNAQPVADTTLPNAELIYQNFSGNLLLPRQDLAYHRFTQYCNKNKGMLLLHNVGSGKTLTSLNIALTILSQVKPESQSNSPLKIVVVLPTGLFDNFIKELRTAINGIGGIKKIDSCNNNMCGENSKALNVNTGYSFTYLDNKYEIFEVLYKNINQFVTKPGIYKNFYDFISGSVVIFDEVHRLLRPANGQPTITLCKSFLLNTGSLNGGLMGSCEKFIAMTGTPLNKSINDIKVLMAFISNNETYEDINGEKYSVLGVMGQKIATRAELKYFIQTSTTALINFAVGALGKSLLTQIGLDATGSTIAGVVITGLLSAVQKFGGEPPDKIVNMPENKLLDYTNLQIQNYLQTKNFNQIIQSPLIQQISEQNNINQALYLAGISNENFLQIVKLYLSIYSNIIMVNNKIDINRIKLLSSIFVANRNSIQEMFNILLNAGTYNLSALLKSSITFLSNLIPKIVFQQEILGGSKKHKKNMVGGQLGALMSLITSGIASKPGQKIFTDTTGIPLGFEDSILKSSLNPTYTICQNINTLFGIGMPFDIEKFSKDVKKYISLSDSTIQNGLVKETYDTVYNINGLEAIAKNQANLQGNSQKIADNYLKETAEFYQDVKNTPQKSNYPKKIECFIKLRYKTDQLNFYTKFGSTTFNQYTQNKIFRGTFDIESASKIVGNYSVDILRYGCNYNMTLGKYEYVQFGQPGNPDTPIKDEELPALTFNCSKFNNILANLLFMRTGYMKAYDNEYESDNYIVSQPHFTDTANKLKPNFKFVNEDLSEEEKYNIENLVPYVIKDASATYNYLPIVYSTSDSLGLGLFAGFLKSLGFNYILVHDLDSKERLEASKNKSYMPVKMTDKFMDDPSEKYQNIETKFQKILTDVKTKNIKDNKKYDKEQPLCVLLHNAMTEGIDFKFNPGIFLLEVPNTYGDYDQLCGRVLRTYTEKNYNVSLKEEFNNDYNIRWKLPIKVIYQVICYTGLEKTTGAFGATPYADDGDDGDDADDDAPSHVFGAFGAIPYADDGDDGDDADNVKPLDLTNVTLVSKAYNSMSPVFSSFPSPDVQQWYLLFQQKTLFKEFIEVLNKSSDKAKPEFDGITDMQEIINCVASDPSNNDDLTQKKLGEKMCKQIPGILSMQEYIALRKMILGPDGVQNFKDQYCAGDLLQKTDKGKTIVMNLNPKFIEAKKAIKKKTETCLGNAGSEIAKQKNCHRKEIRKFINVRQAIEKKFMKDNPELNTGTRKSRRLQGQDPENTGLPNGGSGGKNRKRTHKRKQILIKQRFTKKRRFNKKNKNTRKKSKYFLKRNVTKNLNK